MEKESLQKGLFSLVVLLLLLTPFVFFGYLSEGGSSDGVSVELGISSVSPSGIKGGAVIPASCGSPHSGDLCTAPSFGGSSASGSGTTVSVNAGESATLTWACVDSTSSSGVNFSTGSATSGSTSVSPSSNTAYKLICSNGGQGTVNVNVVNPDLTISATPGLVQTGDTSVITWSATSVNSCTVTEDSTSINDAFSGTSGTETTSGIVEETTYTLACTTDGGSTSASATVRIIPVFQEF